MKITITRNWFLGVGAFIGMTCGAIWGCYIGVSLGLVILNILINSAYGMLLGIFFSWIGFAMKIRQAS